jgi:hypothetical protein
VAAQIVQKSADMILDPMIATMPAQSVTDFVAVGHAAGRVRFVAMPNIFATTSTNQPSQFDNELRSPTLFPSMVSHLAVPFYGSSALQPRG